MQLNHRGRPITVQGTVQLVIIQIRNHPDPQQFWEGLFKCCKQLPPLALGKMAWCAFHPDDADGIHTKSGNLQCLIGVSEPADLDGWTLAEIPQWALWILFLGSLMKGRCSDTLLDRRG